MKIFCGPGFFTPYDLVCIFCKSIHAAVGGEAVCRGDFDWCKDYGVVVGYYFFYGLFFDGFGYGFGAKVHGVSLV